MRESDDILSGAPTIRGGSSPQAVRLATHGSEAAVFGQARTVDAVVSSLLGRAATRDRLPLTDRGRQVLALVAWDHSNTAIAAALVVTGKTVESHVNDILSNLALPRTTEDHRRVLMSLVWLGDEPV